MKAYMQLHNWVTTINLAGDVTLHAVIFNMSQVASYFTSRDWLKANDNINLEASCYPNDNRDCDRNVLAGIKCPFDQMITKYLDWVKPIT